MINEKIAHSSSANRIYNWNDIRHDIVEETPKETDFIDIYGEKSVQNDLDRVKRIRLENGITEPDGITESKIQEYATAQEIGEADWFMEEKRAASLFPDDRGQQTAVFLTSDFDDYVNHVDAVAFMVNAESDLRTVTFALDITYNTKDDKLDQKFGWKHPNLKRSGLATVKYFEDTFTHSGPIIRKGRIFALPRFVIGFSPDLSHEITESRMTSSGWGSLSRAEYSTKAKWCVLKELELQSEQMLSALESQKDSRDYQKLYQDIASLNKYFAGAIAASSEADTAHPDWQSYPERDEVFRAIISRKIM
ncbi:hypothetical protein IKE83_01105 [Candidatus Saccharibacteria bacterium]|nr:hypothetical protein [Candidatus Saccharibacteria bacterium]